jgi:hypothetical protein
LRLATSISVVVEEEEEEEEDKQGGMEADLICV